MDLREMRERMNAILDDTVNDQADRLQLAVRAIGEVKFLAQPHLARSEVVIMVAPEVLEELKRRSTETE